MTFVETKLRYQQAIDTLKRDIEHGKYLPGQKLPPIRAISDSLGMNYLTVRKAMKHLAEEGIVRIQHGAGTFVADLPKKPEKKTINIVLACRKYMLDVTQHHPAIGAYIAGAHKRFDSSKYMIQPMFYKEYKFLEDIGDAILSNGTAGVVITDAGTTKRDYEFLRANDVYVVNMNYFVDGVDWVANVETDTKSVFRQAIEHLRGLGHKRIGFIGYESMPENYSFDRIFASLVFEHRLGNPKELTILISNPTGDPHWEDVEDFFDISPLPTAVIVSDEFLADVLLASCERRGIKVPDDLSIVARQDLLPYGHRIPLTAVDGIALNSELVYRACDILADLIEKKYNCRENVVITPKLIVKASTGPVIAGS